jgi:hypothetical protein
MVATGVKYTLTWLGFLALVSGLWLYQRVARTRWVTCR